MQGLLAATMLVTASLTAAEEASAPVVTADPDQAVEEVVVIGRYRAAATDIVSERIDSDVPMDFLDAEGISRVGDSNVAAALRRVPGVTLVQNQFVYVRGLGERYSSSQLNGSGIPSPDLTRNVLPLDIFPAEIIDALSVQKGWSPELPAAFGGGNIDIRTKAIPEDRQFSIKLNTGWNTEGDRDGWTYSGGSDDRWGTDDGTRQIPQALVEGIDRYRGNFSAGNIQSLAATQNVNLTSAQAQFLNRELGTSLNRNIDFKSKSLPADFEGEATGGYRWFLGEDWEVGFLAIGSYNNKWRNRDLTTRSVLQPDETFTETERTINQITMTATLSVGARFTADHEVNWLNMFIRNTEDEANLSQQCSAGQDNRECEDQSNPTRGKTEKIRFEQRDLDITQFKGEHKLGDATLDRLPEWLGFLEGVRDSEVTWFYTDSKAATDLPNETTVQYVDGLDAPYGNAISSNILASANSIQFLFSDLADEVETWGGQLTVPFTGNSWDLELSGGGSYNRKGRSFQQLSFALATQPTDGFAAISGLPISEALSDENILDPNVGITTLTPAGRIGTESYGAGQITDAGFGKFDLLVNDTWRLSGGARWENFRQVSVPIDYLNFDGQRIPLSPEEIEESTFLSDEWYPMLSATWIRPGFWGDEFQLRFAWSETVARPDLREISDSAYIDPITEATVRGNPELVPSDLSNIDLRAEWFWDSGDNMTVSLFWKDITDPIETVQQEASEDSIVFSYINATDAEIYGIEFEGLKSLGFLSSGGWSDQFYLAGNVTLSDSEVNIPESSAAEPTNFSRRLTQHSEWVVNLQLGYDSFNAKHGATLVYNAFGERIFFAGIRGFDDAYEQPFHSLDFVYSFYPTENLSLKLRLQNLLDETTTIEQDGVKILDQTVGVSFLFDIKYEL